jgi:glycosyltransferase involved in cell wall biosynthesis
MRVVHLTASTFFGGPERQMLGLGRALPGEYKTSFVSFSEGGRCREFLRQARWNGFDGDALCRDTPNLPAATWELSRRLAVSEADVLICHGYKSNLLGRLAARALRIPVISVCRGWTGENLKVHAYELLDRLHLRYMDRVVCVSEGQARRVRQAGMPPARTVVIRNAARLTETRPADPRQRAQLQQLFARPGEVIVVSAGRLSPEKGFSVLIDAARQVLAVNPGVRFAIFGEGTQRSLLERMIAKEGLCGIVVLPGFRNDLDQLLSCTDVFVLPSFTEGLPNVVLEAGAAAVPVVATAVGGTPEVVIEGETGFLVRAGDATGMAHRIIKLVSDTQLRERLGQAGREHVKKHFTFEAQAHAYMRLFESLGARRGRQVAA